MQTLSCMCLSWGSHKTTFIYPQRGALITLLEQCTPCCYSHLSNKQGGLDFFSDFTSLLAKIPSSKFINLLQNFLPPCGFYLHSDFTIAAPCSRLFPPPSVSIEFTTFAPLLVYSLLLGYQKDESRLLVSHSY